MPLLKHGLHPKASDALRESKIEPWRIGQTIGAARASAGTHAADGNIDGSPYCCAVDIKVRGLPHGEVRDILDRLSHHGFAGWFRDPGADGWPGDEYAHIHAIYCGAPMKELLRAQIHDWMHRRNGLASHGNYDFWRPCLYSRELCRTLFLAHNPAHG